MQQFGQRITELRKESGETQESLLEALGVSQQTLSRYEKGQRQASLEFVIRAAKYYNVSADYLLGLSNAKSTEQDMKIACEVTGLSEETIKKLRGIQTSEKPPISGELLISALEQCIQDYNFWGIIKKAVLLNDQFERSIMLDKALAKIYIQLKGLEPTENLINKLLDNADTIRRTYCKGVTTDMDVSNWEMYDEFTSFCSDFTVYSVLKSEIWTQKEYELLNSITDDYDYQIYKYEKEVKGFFNDLIFELPIIINSCENKFFKLLESHQDFLIQLLEKVKVQRNRAIEEANKNAQHNPEEE